MLCFWCFVEDAIIYWEVVSQARSKVKYGSGPRPAARRAKRRFLNCLETSLTPSSTASKASLKDQNTMAVKYGPGPWPAAHSAKRRFLNCLGTSLTPSSTASKASLKDRSRRAKTPWQWSTDRARGRQPVVPNVAFWTA